MIKSARLRLTLWYLLIIASVTLFFSSLVYGSVVMAAKRAISSQETGYLNSYLKVHSDDPQTAEIKKYLMNDERTLIDFKNKVLMNLLALNGVIILLGGGLSYLLSGVMLKPIQEKIDAQKKFMSNAAHELKTPISVLHTEIELALRNHRAKKEDYKKHLISLKEEVQNLRHLSDELLRHGKWDISKEELIFEELNIKILVEETIEILLPLANDRDITINKDLQSGSIKGNKTSLIELMTIILDNAIKYSPEGGSIDIKSYVANRRVHIEFKDYGVGIPKSEIPKIFERFYNSDKKREKTGIQGYGLGLSIAKNIAVLHDAKIEVKSRLKKGSTFSIIFKQF